MNKNLTLLRFSLGQLLADATPVYVPLEPGRPLDLERLGHNSPAYLHQIIETVKLALQALSVTTVAVPMRVCPSPNPDPHCA